MKKYNFGAKVQFYRERQGATQEKLAEAIGISQNFLSAIEQGKKFPSFETLIRIIDTLDVTADDLFEDIIKNGYKAKENKLSDQLDNLSLDMRKQILTVVEAMINSTHDAVH